MRQLLLDDPLQPLALILVRDRGRSMKSRLAKSLHTVAGEPMIARVVNAALEFGCQPIIVVSDPRAEPHNQSDTLKEEREEEREETERFMRMITDAITSSLPHAPPILCVSSQALQSRVSDFTEGALARERDVWIMASDLPHLTASALKGIHDRGIERDAERDAELETQAQLLSVCVPELALVHTRASILRVITAINIVNLKEVSCLLEGAVDQLTAGVPRRNLIIERAQLSEVDAQAFQRVRDRVTLARAEAQAQTDLAERVMLGGVTLLRPQTLRLESRVEVGQDTLIEEDVTLLGDTRIGPDVVIERGCRIVDSVINAGAHIRAYSHIEGAYVGPAATVGPFARLREGTRLERAVKVGNFVEIKKTTLEEGAKASHLSYLGDAHIGRGANIGAGTITCNYDGYQKHRTEIGEGAFIGSDTQLVAPVKIGAGAIIAAGTTVTSDVESNALVLTRPQAVTRPEWATRFRERQHKPSKVK